MKILAMDTSTQALGVAILDGGQPLVDISILNKLTHGERLMPTIEWAFENSPFSIQEIDRIAVTQGPGSYTGLRIGVTTAKSLAWSLGKDLVGLSTLEVLAANGGQRDGLLLPLLDARRGNIYAGLYRNQSGHLQNVGDDRHVSARELAEGLAQAGSEKVYLLGPDAESFYPIFKGALSDRVLVADTQRHAPSALVLGQRARYASPQDIHSFSPHYLKLTEAEENWIKDHPEAKEDDHAQKITRLDR